MPVLAWVSGNPQGLSALETAVAEARLRNAELLLMWFVSDSDEDASGSPSGLRKWLGRVEGSLESLESLRRAEGEITIEYEVVSASSDPANEVLEAAVRMDADLLVIGVRRRSPVGKLVLGSAEQTVLLKARCPVLAVKAAEPQR